MYTNNRGGYREDFPEAPAQEIRLPTDKPVNDNGISIKFTKSADTLPSFQNCVGMNLSRTTSGYPEVHPSVPAMQ